MLSSLVFYFLVLPDVDDSSGDFLASVEAREGAILDKDHSYNSNLLQSLTSQGVLTSLQMNILLDYDKQPLEDRLELLEERGPELVELYVLLFHQAGEVLDYGLTLVDQFLTASPQLGTYFHTVPTHRHAKAVRNFSSNVALFPSFFIYIQYLIVVYIVL